MIQLLFSKLLIQPKPYYTAVSCSRLKRACYRAYILDAL